MWRLSTQSVHRIKNHLTKLMVLAGAIIATQGSYANPVLSPTIAPQGATVSQTATTTTVNQSSQSAILNWQSFNINKNETTHFQQPSDGIALNRIDPSQGVSQIFGSLTATGRIILINQAGIYFGPTAHVDVAGLIASTVDMTNANFLAGKYVFDQNSSTYNGSIVNQGTIIAAHHGLVALIGNNVENDGTIKAHLGNVILASGDKFTVGFGDDGLVNFTIDAPASAIGSHVTNKGYIFADGGTIQMAASAAAGVLDSVINMSGVVQADSVSKHNGVIILNGGISGTVTVAGTLAAAGVNPGTTGGTVEVLGNIIQLQAPTIIDVNGDIGGGTILIGGNFHGAGPEQNATQTTVAAGVSLTANAITSGNGGNIAVWSNDQTGFYGSISATGGAQGGNGGYVETSGENLNVSGAEVNLSAPQGQDGTWLLDPYAITISSSSSNPGFTNPYTETTNSTLNVTDLTNGLADANVTVEASGAQGDIIVATPISWTSSSTLSLIATEYIQLNANITAPAGGLTLSASNGTQSLTQGTIGSGNGMAGSVPGSVTAAIDVNNFTLASGQWYQASSSLPLFEVTGNFSIASGTEYNNAFNAQFTRVNNTSSPYTIIDEFGLQGVATGPLSASYTLGGNIDATLTQGWNNGQGFIPIGESTAYSGTFNGEGNIILNLYMNNSLPYAGLFGQTSSATVENTGLINSTIVSSASTAVGGLIGSAIGTTVTADFSDGSILYQGNGAAVGGLIGFASGLGNNLTVSYSGNDITSVGATYVGGLIGESQATNPTNVYAYGTISADNATDAGGLIGFMAGGSGEGITDAYSSGAVYGAGTTNIGGLVGAASSGTITSSYYDSTICAGCSSSTGGTPESTANLLQASTYSGWGISQFDDGNTNTWYMQNGNTRPILAMELSNNNVNTPHGLQLVSALNAISGGTFEQTANIDLSGILNPSDVWAGMSFVPIGDNNVSFFSIYNGNYYAINNLYVNSNTINNIGLFGVVGGTGTLLENVILNNPTILSNATNISSNPSSLVNNDVVDAGVLAGVVSDSAEVQNISVSGGAISVINLSNGNVVDVGGLIGEMSGSPGNLSSSYNGASINVTGLGNVGGIVGAIANTAGFNINDVYNTGSLSSNTIGSSIGGLIGAVVNSANVTLNTSYNAGNVPTLPGTNAGAIIGYVDSSSQFTMNNLFWDAVATGIGTVGDTSGTGAIGLNSSSSTLNGSTFALNTSDMMSYQYGYPSAFFNLTETPTTGQSLPDSTWFIFPGMTRPMLVSELGAPGSTITSPYGTPGISGLYITNAHQLQLMESALGINYTLANPISLTSGMTNFSDVWATNTNVLTGSGFQPIGGNNGFVPAYTGIFNGNDYTINGLYLTTSFADNLSNLPDTDSIGLFGTVTGSIANVGLTNVSIAESFLPTAYQNGDTNAIGSLVGYLDGGTVTNAYATGTINFTSPIISNVYLGGLVGYSSGGINNSYSTTAINFTPTEGDGGFNIDMGGLLGFNAAKGTVSQSYANAAIAANVTTAQINSSVGGTSGEIVDTGGLVGKNAGVIATSFDIGTTSITNVQVETNTGGLVGENASGGVINDSYSTGSVSVSGGYTVGNFNGGFVGANDSGATINGGLWDVVTSGETAGFGTGSGSYTLYGGCFANGGSCNATTLTNATNSGTNATVYDLSQLSTYTMAGWSTTAGVTGSISDTVSTSATAPNYSWFIFNDVTRPLLMSEYSVNISTPYQLQLAGTTLNASYVLTNNIDVTNNMLNVHDVWGANSNNLQGTGFASIGNSTTPFTGTFNGDNYTISSLYIFAPSADYIGLIGDNTGNVVNVGLINPNIEGRNYVGSLVGSSDAGSNIVNSYATVTNGNNTAGVFGQSYLGGLVGYDASNMNADYTSDSLFVQSLNGAQQYIGGLVGYTTGATSQFQNNFAIANVNAGNATDVGGLVGYNAIGTSGLFANSYAGSSVRGSTNVGGLIGGLASSTLVTQTYSSATSVSGSSNVGGLIGSNAGTPSANVTNSFFDSTLCPSCSAAAGGTAESTTDLMNPATFSSWNIISTGTTGGTPATTSPWFIFSGNTRPVLLSEWSPTITNVYQLQLMGAALGGNYSLANIVDTFEVNSTAGDIWGTNGSGQGFAPIGNATTPFVGNFNGNNYTINNLFIQNASNSYVGLFGYVGGSSYDGEIQNVTLDNAQITNNFDPGRRGANVDVGSIAGYIQGSGADITVINNVTISNVTLYGASVSTIGGIVGDLSEGTLSNSSNAASISASSNAGGIAAVGGDVGSTVLINDTNTGSVNTSADAGGLIGTLSTNTSTILNSYNTGAVTSSNASAGGLVGGTENATVAINNSYNTGTVAGEQGTGGILGAIGGGTATIIGTYNLGAVTDNSIGAGGIVGDVNPTPVTISLSYNAGAINNTAGPAGGLIGASNGTNTITSDYNIGPVSGTSGNATGGLIGNLTSSTTTISESYNSGPISGSTTMGALIGSVSGGTTTFNTPNTYWDSDVDAGLNAIGAGTGSGSTAPTHTAPLSTSAFLSTSSFSGWSISTSMGATWYQISGSTRPILQAEYNPVITTGHQLELIGLNPSANYSLNTNIDLSDTQNVSPSSAQTADVWGGASGQGFVPISDFLGTFNGNNDTIANLNINTSSSNDIGLFGDVGVNLQDPYSGFPAAYSGWIANVGLISPSITDASSSNVGALAGMIIGTFDTPNFGSTSTEFAPLIMSNTVLYNDYVSNGTITGNTSTTAQTGDSTGGLVGYLALGLASNLSNNSTTVNGNLYTGGLIGLGDTIAVNASSNSGTISTACNGCMTGGLVGALNDSYFLNYSDTTGANISISNSTNSGNVSAGGTNGAIGGIVGAAGWSANNLSIVTLFNVPVFYNTSNSGSISAAYFNTGPSYVGGITGIIDGGTSFNPYANYLQTIFNTGIITVGVSAATTNANVGGVIGSLLNESSVYTSAYNTGSVTVNSNLNDIGGIVGNADSSSWGMTVTNSFNSGSIQGGSSDSIGGLVGDALNTAITNSFNIGLISETAALSNSYVGGLIGNGNNSSTNSISTSYNAGFVSASAGNNGAIVGNGGTGVNVSSTTYWDTGSNQVSGCTGGHCTPTAEASSSLLGTLPTGFSSSTWGTSANNYPYLLSFSQAIQEPNYYVISGTFVGSGAGSTVDLLANGSLFDTTLTNSNGYFAFIESPVLSTSSDLFLYINGNSNYASNIFALSPVATTVIYTSGLSSGNNDITVDGSLAAASNTFLGTASGGLNSAGILFTTSGSNLTLGNSNTNGNTANLITAAATTYTVDGSIATNTGGTSTVTFNGPTIINGGSITTSGTQAYNNPVTLGADTVLSGSDIATSSSGTINGGGFNLDIIDTDTTSSASNTLAGVISNINSFTKDGAGTISLSAAETYSGATSINDGTLALTGSGSLPSSTDLTLGNNSTFDISAANANQTIGSLNDNGSATGDTVVLGSNSITMNDGSSTVFAGVISGTGGVTLGNSSAMTLSGNNTFSGGLNILGSSSVTVASINNSSNPGPLGESTVTLNSGTVYYTGNSASSNLPFALAGGGGTLDVVGGSNLTLSTAITGSGGFTFTDAGTLTLSAAATYSGATTINGGTIALSGSGALPSATDLTLGSNSTFDISAANGNQTIGSLNDNGTATGDVVTLGSNSLVMGDSLDTAFAGAINGSGSVTKNGSDTITLSGNSTFSGGLNINEGAVSIPSINFVANPGPLGQGTVTLGSNTNAATLFYTGSSAQSDLTFVLGSAGGIFDVSNNGALELLTAITGAGGLTKNDAGGLSLAAAASYNGSTTINGGTIYLTGNGALPGTSDLTMAANTTFDISGITSTTTTIGSFNDYGTTSGSDTVNLGGNNLVTGDTVNTTFSGVIEGSGGSLTKQGSDIMTLSAANTYSGGTTVNAGNLTITNENALGTEGQINVNNSILEFNISSPSNSTLANASQINLNEGTLSISSSVTLTLNNNIVLSGGLNPNYNVLNITGHLTDNGTITGNYDLNIQGNGTLNLLNSMSIGDLSVSIANIDIDANLTIATTGTQIYTKQMTIEGGTNLSLSGSDVELASTAAINNPFVPLGAGQEILTVSDTDTTSSSANTFAGVMYLVGFVKEGAGILTLSNASNFIDSSVVVSTNGGTLNLTNVHALGNNPASITVDSGGALQLTNLTTALSDTSSITLNGGTISTNGTSSLFNSITLGATGNSITTTNNSNVFTLTGGTISGSNDLTLSGPGTIVLSDTVNNIASLTSNTNTTLSSTSTISTSGNQTFNDPVTVAANTTLNAGSGNISLAAVDSSSASPFSLSLSNSGTVTLGGDIGDNYALSSLNITNTGSSSFTLANNITTRGNITLSMGGSIAESTGILTGATLTTTSVGGTQLNNNNVLTGFNATNSTSGNISFNNLSNSNTLTVSGITQNSSGDVAITNAGAVVLSGAAATIDGNFSITATNTSNVNPLITINSPISTGSGSGGVETISSDVLVNSTITLGTGNVNLIGSGSVVTLSNSSPSESVSASGSESESGSGSSLINAALPIVTQTVSNITASATIAAMAAVQSNASPNQSYQQNQANQSSSTSSSSSSSDSSSPPSSNATTSTPVLPASASTSNSITQMMQAQTTLDTQINTMTVNLGCH